MTTKWIKVTHKETIEFLEAERYEEDSATHVETVRCDFQHGPNGETWTYEWLIIDSYLVAKADWMDSWVCTPLPYVSYEDEPHEGDKNLFNKYDLFGKMSSGRPYKQKEAGEHVLNKLKNKHIDELPMNAGIATLLETYSSISAKLDMEKPCFCKTCGRQTNHKGLYQGNEKALDDILKVESKFCIDCAFELNLDEGRYYVTGPDRVALSDAKKELQKTIVRLMWAELGGQLKESNPKFENFWVHGYSPYFDSRDFFLTAEEFYAYESMMFGSIYYGDHGCYVPDYNECSDEEKEVFYGD